MYYKNIQNTHEKKKKHRILETMYDPLTKLWVRIGLKLWVSTGLKLLRMNHPASGDQ